MMLLDEMPVAIAPGEYYAGLILGNLERRSHHVILLPGELSRVNWRTAHAWSQNCGGDLPSRRELALLFANRRECFQEGCYWSGEPFAVNSLYAWNQFFCTGTQYNDHVSNPLMARAIRRVAVGQ